MQPIPSHVETASTLTRFFISQITNYLWFTTRFAVIFALGGYSLLVVLAQVWGPWGPSVVMGHGNIQFTLLVDQVHWKVSE